MPVLAVAVRDRTHVPATSMGSAVMGSAAATRMAVYDNRAVTCAPEATEAAADGGLICMVEVIR